VVWELRNSATLLGGVFLDDSIVGGLILISLSMKAVTLWKGRWLSFVSRVVLVPSVMSSQEIFSWGLICIVFELFAMNFFPQLLCSWGSGFSSDWSCWSSGSWSLCFDSGIGLSGSSSLSGCFSSSLSNLSGRFSNSLSLFSSSLGGLLTSFGSWGGDLS